MNFLRWLWLVPAALPQLVRWSVRRVFYRQLYFSGVQAIPLILLIGVAVGAIVVSQLHYAIGQSGEGSLKLLAIITFSELAPLLTAIVLAARSSSAMSSELAMMRVAGELDDLRWQGIDPLAYLVLPRVLAMTLASGLLASYFALSALLTGALGVANFNWWRELLRLADALPLAMLVWCPLKGLVFGAAIALVACHRGFYGFASSNDVPIAASQAVVRAFSVVFVLDLVFILLGQMR